MLVNDTPTEYSVSIFQAADIEAALQNHRSLLYSYSYLDVRRRKVIQMRNDYYDLKRI